MILDQICKWKPTHKGAYVMTGPQQCLDPIRKIGRVVQVRLKSGAFGSDTVLLRHADGMLVVHENQWFYTIPDQLKEEIGELYKDLDISDDADENEYTLSKNKEPRKGFIIPSELPEGTVTPMDRVKNAIKQEIAIKLEKNNERRN